MSGCESLKTSPAFGCGVAPCCFAVGFRVSDFMNKHINTLGNRMRFSDIRVSPGNATEWRSILAIASSMSSTRSRHSL
jgi:hypothetical protein